MPDAVVERLRRAGCVYAEDEAALLREAADDDAALDGLVRRREAGEPLEVVVGWAEFCGLRIHVDPLVFVPRRRTELLARTAVELLAPGEARGASWSTCAAARARWPPCSRRRTTTSSCTRSTSSRTPWPARGATSHRRPRCTRAISRRRSRHACAGSST